ncbi:MAG TPA: 30S ribosomal protein S5 [archaeon]|nr:30S ribosomal protein S5 [archaeon]
MPRSMVKGDSKPRRGRKPEDTEGVPETERKLSREEETRQRAVSEWVPATDTGRKVKNGEISSLDEFFSKGFKIMEPEIVDALVPELKEKLVEFSKTTRITRQGRNFSFRAAVLVGDGEAFIGLGTAKDKEKYPAISKATRNAKLAIRKVRKSCGSWECRCRERHSVPFNVTGSCGSVRVKLMPSPKGTGLVVGDNIKDVFVFAGIKDVWSKCFGRTSATLEFVTAAVNALHATNNVRLSEDIAKKLEEKR